MDGVATALRNTTCETNRQRLAGRPAAALGWDATEENGGTRQATDKAYQHSAMQNGLVAPSAGAFESSKEKRNKLLQVQVAQMESADNLMENFEFLSEIFHDSF